MKEDDVDELTSDSFKDCDVSSISGSEDESEKEINSRKGPAENVNQKLFVRLQNGLRVSVWRCLVVNESDNISFEDEKTGTFDNVGNVSCLRENEVVNRFKNLIQEPRDNSRLRIVLLASGGHFAGCVFDGNSVVAHKTFHRFVCFICVLCFVLSCYLIVKCMAVPYNAMRSNNPFYTSQGGVRHKPHLK